MTAELIPPGAPEFVAKFCRIRYSAFRLETLQRYANSGEDAAIDAFLAGEQGPPRDPFDDEWEAMIRANVRSGRTMHRVHVVTEPLSDYMRFELTWAYAPNAAAGEDIRIIPVPAGGHWPPDLPEPGVDYWLFDSIELYRQHYCVHGDWLGTERVKDAARVAEACAWRDAAWHQGVPWLDYIRHQQLVGYLPPDTLAS
jgi:hypothetical protein